MIPLGTVPFGIVLKNSTKQNRPQWYFFLYLRYDSVFEFEGRYWAARG